MANMFPESYHEDPDSPSPAERKLFKALKDQLPDTYTVFHSRTWHALNDRGAARDGEADFVIAHPDHGILVVEAKSGGVEYEAKLDTWHAVGLGGHRGREIDSPVKLAMARGEAVHGSVLSERSESKEPSRSPTSPSTAMSPASPKPSSSTAAA